MTRLWIFACSQSSRRSRASVSSRSGGGWTLAYWIGIAGHGVTDRSDGHLVARRSGVLGRRRWAGVDRGHAATRSGSGVASDPDGADGPGLG